MNKIIFSRQTIFFIYFLQLSFQFDAFSFEGELMHLQTTQTDCKSVADLSQKLLDNRIFDPQLLSHMYQAAGIKKPKPRIADITSSNYLDRAKHKKYSQIQAQRTYPRDTIEFESTYNLRIPKYCTLPNGQIVKNSDFDINALYKVLSENNYRQFRDMRKCESCMAYHSSKDPNAINWSKKSHETRMLSPYIWPILSYRNTSTNRAGEPRLNFTTDLMDDLYADTPGFKLYSDHRILRARKRWGSWRANRDPADFRIRVLVASKKILPTDSTKQLKQSQKIDDRLNFGAYTNQDNWRYTNHKKARTIISNLFKDFISGNYFGAVNEDLPIRAISSTYDYLSGIDALEDVGNHHTGETYLGVMALEPKAYIRSIRSRFHHYSNSYVSGGKPPVMNIFYQLGFDILQTKLAPLILGLSKKKESEALLSLYKEISSILDRKTRFPELIAKKLPKMSIAEVRDILSSLQAKLLARSKRKYTYFEEAKLVADTVSEIFHNLSEQIRAIKSELAIKDEEIELFLRKLETSGRSLQVRWYQHAVDYYVPNYSCDRYINTFDLSGMYDLNAWDGVPEVEQTNQKSPNPDSLFNASIVNEVQMELDCSKPFTQEIERLQSIKNPTIAEKARLKGINFIFNEHLRFMDALAKLRGKDLIQNLKTDRSTKDLFARLKCFNWEPTKYAKGQKAVGYQLLKEVQRTLTGK